jgi:Lrp/AsnC family leucine-responsive transcriptional regulator
MDETDFKILSILQKDADTSLKKIGLMAGLNSPSAVSRRIEAMKKAGIIKKDISIIDYKSIGYGFYTITFIRAKYGKDYYKELGKKLQNISGVISVDFLLGDIDFILYTISKNPEEYQKLMDTLSTLNEIERTDSHVILENFSRDNYCNVKLVDNNLNNNI